MSSRLFMSRANLLFKNALVITAVCAANMVLAAEGDAAKGKAKSMICASCHGKDGVGVLPTYPNLAGQKAAYTEMQLRAFRDGLRKNMVMTPMAKPLSDQDILNLAAYYESLPAKK